MPVIYQFTDRPDIEAVMVSLQRSAAGTTAEVIYPPMADGLQGLPRGRMEVHTALAAAVFLAGRENLKLRVTGDQSAWLPQWGQLVFADHFASTAH